VYNGELGRTGGNGRTERIPHTGREKRRNKVRLTIVYDNTTRRDDCGADWGFSCVVEAHGRRLLFDTGTKGELLLANMSTLGIEPASIDEVVISHEHFDHLGGLPAFIDRRGSLPVHLPRGCPKPAGEAEFSWADHRAVELAPGLHSTGTLGGIEQGLVVELERGVAVIVGCSHPGADNLLEAARAVGEPQALIGGLHGFRRLGALKGLKLVCPTHCTVFKGRIRHSFPTAYREGGVGTVIDL